MSMQEMEDDEITKPTVRHKEEIITLYKFKEQEKEIPVLKEVPIEATTKKEIFELLDAMKEEMKGLYQILRGLVKYQIKEQEVISQIVKEVPYDVAKPVFRDKEIINPVLKDVPIDRPVYYDKRIDQISKADLETLAEYKKSLAGVYEMLQKIRTYKIQEDTVRRVECVHVPKKVEIVSEKVVLDVSSEVIESVEELLGFLKKNKRKEE